MKVGMPTEQLSCCGFGGKVSFLAPPPSLSAAILATFLTIYGEEPESMAGLSTRHRDGVPGHVRSLDDCRCSLNDVRDRRGGRSGAVAKPAGGPAEQPPGPGRAGLGRAVPEFDERRRSGIALRAR